MLTDCICHQLAKELGLLLLLSLHLGWYPTVYEFIGFKEYGHFFEILVLVRRASGCSLLACPNRHIWSASKDFSKGQKVWDSPSLLCPIEVAIHHLDGHFWILPLGRMEHQNTPKHSILKWPVEFPGHVTKFTVLVFSSLYWIATIENV